jgi:hypothetical protein
MKFIQICKENIPSIIINKKELSSTVLFLSILYAVAFISIFRSDYTYLDDIERSVFGNDMRGDFSRYISEFLSYFLHTTGERLTDISPLPQLLACVFLALTGFIVVKVMCKKPTKYLLLATLPIGLSPNFLGCMSFKFDAPYMALSVLVSVFPFLFMHTNRWLYACASVISLLIMTMTYQASSGIFVMMSLYFFFRTILYKSDSTKNAFIFLGISCLSYGVALGLFRLCFLQIIPSYASTDIQINHNLVTLFWNNLGRYFSLLYKDWNVIWKITALVIVVIFYIKTIILSKRRKITAFFITTLFLALLICSIFGVYTLLEEPSFVPRAMYGIGVFLAILSVDICFSLKKIFSFPVMVLGWCFFVFAFAYGNCLADQKRYKEFRAGMVMHDVSQLLTSTKPYKLTIRNGIGLSGVAKNVVHNNPIVKRMIYTSLSYNYLSYYYKLSSLQSSEKPSVDEETMPIVLNNYYHIIKKNDDEIVVILK